MVHVIYIDFSRVPQNCDSYEQNITSIYEKIKSDLIDFYNIKIRKTHDSLSTLFHASKDTFIFIMDGWDSIFYKDFMEDKDKKAYLEFLKGLLKDQPYAGLAYMTGVLPNLKQTYVIS